MSKELFCYDCNRAANTECVENGHKTEPLICPRCNGSAFLYRSGNEVCCHACESAPLRAIPNDAEVVAELRLVIGSLIDIVGEMAVALEAAKVADDQWAQLVLDTLREHKRSLHFEL